MEFTRAAEAQGGAGREQQPLLLLQLNEALVHRLRQAINHGKPRLQLETSATGQPQALVLNDQRLSLAVAAVAAQTDCLMLEKSGEALQSATAVVRNYGMFSQRLTVKGESSVSGVESRPTMVLEGPVGGQRGTRAAVSSLSDTPGRRSRPGARSGAGVVGDAGAAAAPGRVVAAAATVPVAASSPTASSSVSAAQQSRVRAQQDHAQNELRSQSKRLVTEVKSVETKLDGILHTIRNLQQQRKNSRSPAERLEVEQQIERVYLQQKLDYNKYSAERQQKIAALRRLRSKLK